MHVALPSGTVVRTADGDIAVDDMPAGCRLLDGSVVQAVTPRRTDRDVAVFEAGALDGLHPMERLYLPVEAVVRRWDSAPEAYPAKWFVAGGIANGQSIYLMQWPRRLRCYTVSTPAQWICLAHGIDVATRMVPPGSGYVATISPGGDSAPVQNLSTFPDTDAIPLEQRELPVLLVADGQWAAFIAHERAAEDLVFHFRVHAACARLQVLSPAYLPHESPDSGPEARRFGVAVLEIAIDGRPLDLEGDALSAGFYAPEGEAQRRWRWTNGVGSVAIPAGEQARMVTLRITDWHELLRQPAG